jgi:predicted Zn finger-like uncharacterized protein
MNVACPGCQTRYSVDDGRIPPSGVTIECPKCHHSFVVKKEDGQRPVSLPGAQRSAVKLPGSRAAPSGQKPAGAITDELDLGLDLDDAPPPGSAPPRTSAPARTAPPQKPAPQQKSAPRSAAIADSGLLDFIDQTAEKAGVRGTGASGSELRVRRLNGHVEGPYGSSRLVAMLRQGELEGTEEVSEDGRSWRSIGQHPDLADAVQEALSRDSDMGGFTDLPGPVEPKDLPGLPDKHRNLPGPADLHRNLPAPGGLPAAARSVPPAQPPRKAPSLDDDLELPPTSPPASRPLFASEDSPTPELALDDSRENEPAQGARIVGMTAEQAQAMKRPSIDPSLLELGDVPQIPSIWEQYKKPILGFVGVLGVFLIGAITQIFTPWGAFGYKSMLALFEPPPPPPPEAPKEAPVKLVNVNEIEQLLQQASFEGFRSGLATLKTSERTPDNLLLGAKAHALATLLYGKDVFSIEEAKAALTSATSVDTSKAKGGNALAAKNELLKAKGALALVEGNVQSVLPELTAGLEADPENVELALVVGLAQATNGAKVDALKALDGALVRNPKYAPAMHAIGDIVVGSDQGGPAEAVNWYEKAIAAEPTHVRSALAAAKLYEALKKPGDRRRMLARAAAEVSKGAPPDKRAEILLQAARAFDDAGRLGEAVAFAAEAARLEPAKNDYVALAGRAFVAADKGKEALGILQDTLQRSPDDGPALLARAEAYMATADITKAFQDALAARRVMQKSYEPYLLEGLFNVKLGKLTDARDALTIAVKFAGDSSPKPLLALGELELDVGNIDAVFQHATAAVQAHPDYSPGHTLLGETYRRRGQLAEALASFEKALELDSERLDAKIGLANTLRDIAARSPVPSKSAELARAVPLYNEAVERDPKNANLSFEYGRALELQGQGERALEIYRQAVAINEKDARPYLAMIAFFMRSAKPNLDEAKAALKQAEKAAPLDPDTAFWKARIAFSEQRYEDAQRALEPALQAQPKNADYHYWSGRIYDAMDSLYEAVSQYELAVQLNSRLGPAYRALGNAAIQKHRFEQARDYFSKYRKAVPEDESIWTDIGLSWIKQNKDKEGMAALQKALAADPKNPVALLEIGAIHARNGEDKKAIDLFRKSTDADAEFGDAWCQLGLALGPTKRSQELSKDAQKALKQCIESSNAQAELKATAKQVLASAGVN